MSTTKSTSADQSDLLLWIAGGTIAADEAKPLQRPSPMLGELMNDWETTPWEEQAYWRAAGLEEKLVTPSQVLDCGNGEITIANITIREHDGHRYEHLSFEDVIVNSSNVGTVRVGLALGQERLYGAYAPSAKYRWLPLANAWACSARAGSGTPTRRARRSRSA